MEKPNSALTGAEISHPKVSVCVMTYNQRNYIGQCLQSLVDQIAPFDFEIIVADDCSQDGTSEIVREFSNKYPHLIRSIIHPKNIGVFKNYWSVHLAARGEFIAHMDGDDYALPGKLAEQVSFLDANPECVMCGHAMALLTDGVATEKKIGTYPKISTVESFLVYGNFVAHSSTMYRATARLTPSCFDETMIDFQLHVARTGRGRVGFINKNLGVYRVVNTGMVSGYYSGAKFFHCNVDAIKNIEKVVGPSQLVDQALFNLCSVWMKNFIAARRPDLAREVYGSECVMCFDFKRKFLLKLMLIFSVFVGGVFRFKRRFL